LMSPWWPTGERASASNSTCHKSQQDTASCSGGGHILLEFYIGEGGGGLKGSNWL
jgi:hypothetical protein